ncbi:MAG: ATP-dependent helicase, partial [Pelomonas sp.]|nr:ATP-dependent helicase [Roseateles sp.]
FNAEDYVHRIGRTGRAGASGLAVTLVTRADARNVADIEKLIKRKIELEPFEVEAERRPPRDRGERRERDGGDREPRAWREPREREIRESTDAPRRSAPVASRDPFFDKPYEASAASAEAKPAWDKPRGAASAPAAAPRSVSANIKAKRQVAALFGAKPAPAPTSTES